MSFYCLHPNTYFSAEQGKHYCSVCHASMTATTPQERERCDNCAGLGWVGWTGWSGHFYKKPCPDCKGQPVAPTVPAVPIASNSRELESGQWVSTKEYWEAATPQPAQTAEQAELSDDNRSTLSNFDVYMLRREIHNQKRHIEDYCALDAAQIRNRALDSESAADVGNQKMITADQLVILKDIFENCHEDWLLEHLSVVNRGYRKFVIEVDDSNWQDWTELFESTEQTGAGS